MDKSIRWKQRLENFERAFSLFKETFEKNPDDLSDLEKEGVIQRFEYTFDVKDYEAIKHVPLKQHIDEFGKILYSAC